MKTGEVVDAYKALSDAKVSELTADERIAVVKAMKAMRATVKDFDAFVEDLRKKFETPNMEAIVQKLQMNKGLTEAEAEEFMGYNMPVGKAISEERNKDVDIEIPRIGEDAVMKMIGENGWKMSKYELLEMVM